MNKKLLVLLTLTIGQATAMEPMELAIDDERAIPTDITEKKVVIPIQDQEREIPARFIPLIGALAGFYVEGTPLQMSPITLVSLETWKLIEDQLERAYEITQDNQEVRNEIIADYSKLANNTLIDLTMAVDFLGIAHLKEITLEVAYENILTVEEILELPEYVRNELIKRKALRIAGPVLIKNIAVCRSRVRSVYVTPDGKIVSGSWDTTVRIWDMNGQELAVCRGHVNHVWSVCVTPDGKIISGSYDNTVRIWDMNGKQLAVCRGHEGAVLLVCVTPDGKIVSGSQDSTMRIWDLNGHQLAVCRGHKGRITAISVTLDGKIVSGSWDKTVRVWDMNGKQLAVCEGHEDHVNSVCVTSDGKIVSGSQDKTVRIWDLNGQLLAVFRGHENPITSVCVTPDGKIISGSARNNMRIWDMNGKPLAVCRIPQRVKGTVQSICVMPDGKIISGSNANYYSVRIWDMNGQELAICRGLKGGTDQVCVTPDGKIISKRFSGLGVWDISLLDRLSVMSKEQALATCKLLQSATCESQKQKDRCWKQITKILEEEELGIETKKRKELGNRKNNPGKRVRKSSKNKN